MKIVTGTIDQLIERIASRGATLDTIAAAIVSRDGDQVSVDVDHPAYPQAKTKAKPIDMSCRHRGEVRGEAQCSTCSGKVMAKLYACTIHGQCTLFSKPIEGVRSCRGCGDRSSAASLA